jgi:hypothetical protein
MKSAVSLLPYFPNQQKEATKMYTEAIRKVKDIKRPMHLTLQEGNQGGPSCTDIKSILGSDQTFYTMEYIKNGKKSVTSFFSHELQFTKAISIYRSTHQLLRSCNIFITFSLPNNKMHCFQSIFQ